MMEAGVLLDRDFNPFFWHVPPDRTTVSLPDSRNLWDAIWLNRDRAAAFVHTHPGRGLTGPSSTDTTTFNAIEKGLGRALIWLIATEDRLVRVRKAKIESVAPSARLFDSIWITEEELILPTASWLPRLRELSYHGGTND